MRKVLESGPHQHLRPHSWLEIRPIRDAEIGKLCGTSMKMPYSQVQLLL